MCFIIDIAINTKEVPNVSTDKLSLKLFVHLRLIEIYSSCPIKFFAGAGVYLLLF